MIRVEMLKDQRGSRNGTAIENFRAGETHDLPDTLANAFISMKAAKVVRVRQEQEQKDAGSAPENKDAGQAPVNKAPVPKAFSPDLTNEEIMAFLKANGVEVGSGAYSRNQLVKLAQGIKVKKEK